MSSLGGALGLYLGISIILIGEIIEYLLLLLWNLCLNCYGKYNPNDDGYDNDNDKDEENVFVNRMYEEEGNMPDVK